MSELEDIEFEISTIEDRIEQAKQDSAQSKGAISAHLERLRNDVGLTSTKEIKDFISKGEKELVKEEQAIIKNFEVIRDKYDEHV